LAAYQNNRQPAVRKSTVAMNIEVLVEVVDTGSYNDMVSQAVEELRKRVVEAPTFLPMRMKSDRIYNDVKVQELKSALNVEPGSRWNR
jgi:hypothetical protein